MISDPSVKRTIHVVVPDATKVQLQSICGFKFSGPGALFSDTWMVYFELCSDEHKYFIDNYVKCEKCFNHEILSLLILKSTQL